MKPLHLILLLLIAITFFQTSNQLISSKANSYVGFVEAGEWLKNYAKNSIIYAGSMRAIRTFSGFDFYDNGGIIRRVPANLSEFLEEVNNTNETVYLEVDVWEYTQPSWVYPLTQEKFDNLLSNGFNLTYYVTKNIDGKEMPVVFIFKK